MKKKNSFIYKWLVFCVFVLSTSCAKDAGYYNPPATNSKFNGTTLDYLKSKPGVFDSMLVALRRTGLEETLSDSAITLFAVTNPGFQLALTNLNNIRRINDRPAEYLLSINGAHLDTMVTQYIIRGVYPADSMTRQDGIYMNSVRYGYPTHARLINAASSGYITGGPKIVQFSDTKRSQFVRDWVTTTTGSNNIETDNGIVHVIEADHIFGFDDFIFRLTYIPPPPNLFKIIGGIHTVQHESSGGVNGVEGSNNVIDGNPETKFLVGGFTSTWLMFELNEPAVAGAYTLTSANDAETRDPVDWNLQGSLDGVNWVPLNTQTDHVFEERFQQKVFRFNNAVAYKFYRLNITRNNGSSGMQLADWSVNLAN